MAGVALHLASICPYSNYWGKLCIRHTRYRETAGLQNGSFNCFNYIWLMLLITLSSHSPFFSFFFLFFLFMLYNEPGIWRIIGTICSKDVHQKIEIAGYLVKIIFRTGLLKLRTKRRKHFHFAFIIIRCRRWSCFIFIIRRVDWKISEQKFDVTVYFTGKYLSCMSHVSRCSKNFNYPL